jgi:hypothetical protein
MTETDFHSLIDRGKRWAATAVIVAAFLHSLYASYIKEAEEGVAKSNYKVQTEALEGFSTGVDIELAIMSGRLDMLERVCIGALQSRESAPAVRAQHSSQTEEDPEQTEERVYPPPPPDHVAQIPSPSSHYMEQKSLKVRLPDAPWEQVAK